MGLLSHGLPWLTVVAIPAAVFFLMRGWRALVRKIAERKQVEVALLNAYEDMESRVMARTAELVHVKDALEAEVAARKRAEENLQERVQDFEILMAVMPISVFVSRDAQCSRITGNRPSYALLNLPPDTNISKSAPPEEFVAKYRVYQDGKELQPHELPMQYAAAHGLPVQDAEYEYLFEDGSRKQVYGSALPLFTRGGKVRGCIGAFLEITEWKRMTEALRKSETQLQQAQ